MNEIFIKQNTGYVFRRIEMKYLLTCSQCAQLLQRIQPQICPDQYGEHTIYNLYFDTETHDLVRRSLEKPEYKEKMRLRSYGVPCPQSRVYLELKKKYHGVVYKRRICMTYEQAIRYIDQGIAPDDEGQIFQEIDYALHYHHLLPKLYLSYDRVAYTGAEEADLRITFDSNIRSRRSDLQLDRGDPGQPLLDDDQILMEIKTSDAIPFWLARTLSDMRIYPVSFSKYGSVYLKEIQGRNHYVHDRICVN